jgi:hypothetical protein
VRNCPVHHIHTVIEKLKKKSSKIEVERVEKELWNYNWIEIKLEIDEGKAKAKLL